MMPGARQVKNSLFDPPDLHGLSKGCGWTLANKFVTMPVAHLASLNLK